MNLRLENAPREITLGRTVEVGNVYKTQKGILYVIVATHNGNASALQVNPHTGEISGAVTYGEGYFSARALLGIVSNLPDTLEVEWF